MTKRSFGPRSRSMTPGCSRKTEGRDRRASSEAPLKTGWLTPTARAVARIRIWSALRVLMTLMCAALHTSVTGGATALNASQMVVNVRCRGSKKPAGCTAGCGGFVLAVFVADRGPEPGVAGADPVGLSRPVLAGVLVRVGAGGTGCGEFGALPDKLGRLGKGVAGFLTGGHDVSSRDGCGKTFASTPLMCAAGPDAGDTPRPALFTTASLTAPTLDGLRGSSDERNLMGSEEMTAVTIDGAPLRRGQEVMVHAGAEDLGAGVVDDFTEDGSIVWVIFGGAAPRRMFIPEDQARFAVLPPAGPPGPDPGDTVPRSPV